MTSNTQQEAEQKLNANDLSQYFEEIIGNKGPETNFHKPHVIQQLLVTHQLDSSEVVYIGDRNIDYDVARESGLAHLLLVRYGWGFDEDYVKHSNPLVINEPNDILTALQKLDAKKIEVIQENNHTS